MPVCDGYFPDANGDSVQTGTHHLGGHFARTDFKIDDRAVAQIRAAARQTVRVVAIALQVLAPSLAPKRIRNCAAGCGHRREHLTLSLHFRDRQVHRPSTRRRGNIRLAGKIHQPCSDDRYTSDIRLGRMNIKRHQIQQLPVAEFGQLQLGTSLEHILHERLLRLDKLFDLILDGALTDEFVHQNIPRLPDPERPIRCLILDGRIPPTIEMHHMRGGGEIETGASRFQRENEEWNQLVILEAPYQLLALRYRRAAVQNQPFPPKYVPEKRSNRLSRLAELREHEHLLLLGCDHLRELAQAGEFPALGFDPRRIAEPLRWMIADLLEAHQERQYDAFAAHALRSIKRLS